mgnify:CR=1 FL=1
MVDRTNKKDSLFCPNEAPGLADCHGEEFEKLYTKYEKEGRALKTIKAQELWFKILESQVETGTPYILYKDACNKKSNQQNLGTIKSSNLCTEIVEYTAPDEVAVCNLASIAIPMFVAEDENGNKFFDHQKLFNVTKKVIRNLDTVIDRNYYPVVEAENSNTRHRPVGLGIQGLADAFIMLRLPFTSEEAKKLNQEIFKGPDELYKYEIYKNSCLITIENTPSKFCFMCMQYPNSKMSQFKVNPISINIINYTHSVKPDK